MRFTTALATAFALAATLLSACSGKSSGASSASTTTSTTTTAAAGPAAGAYPKAGLWEMTATNSMMPNPIKTRICMGTPAPGSNPFAPPQNAAAAGACAKNQVTKTAEGYAIDMQCAQNGMTMATTGTVTGDFSSGYKTVMTSKMSGANVPPMMQNATTTTVDAKYLGACPAGMAPGAVSQGA